MLKKISKFLISLILLLFIGVSTSIGQCLTPIGIAYDNNCILTPTNPDTLQPNVVVIQCFEYTPTDSCFTLSFLLASGVNCPPGIYNNLSFEVYNLVCDSIIATGTIYPTPSGTWVCTGPGTFVICYKFTPLCQITEICPLINPSPLEVTWLTTKGVYSKEEKRIHIAWSTAQEVDCDYYTIQKLDYNKWKDIGRLKCKEDKFINTYLFLDEVPSEYNYYRIKQVNYNNRFFYSNIFLVKVSDPDVPCCYFTIFGEEVNEKNLKRGMYIKECNGKYSKIIHIN